MKEYISSLIRHSLTSVGGSLVAKGVLTATAFDEIVGALIIIAGVVWSAASKYILGKINLEKLVNALNTPAPEVPVTIADVIGKK
jgi:hypothetical protein